MPLPPDLPVVDHHCHLSPGGQGIAAVRRFERAGGSHLFLTTQNYDGGPITRVEQYRSQFEATIDLAERIRRETTVVAYPVVAPFPVDLVPAAAAVGLDAAVLLHREALELAAQFVAEQRAVALGEVGRPHFPVPPELQRASEDLFVHALELARDAGCPAVVHSEDLDAEGFRSLANLATRAGFPLSRLVKHYARTVLSPEDRSNVVPSYLARRDVVDASLAHPGPWFWETDYLDDPARPGAVLDLATVPRRATTIGQEQGRAEALRIPFVTSVESVYGITPTVDRGVRP